VLFLALAAARAAAAAPPAPISFRIELIESPLAQSQLVRCEIAGDLKANRTGAWALFYGEVRRGDSTSGEALRARAGCEPGRSDELLATKQWSLRGVPYLIADVSVRRSRGKGQNDQVELSITRRKLSGFSKEGAPSYSSRDKTRVFSGKERVTADVPLLISDERERDAFRAYDVLLRIRASKAAENPPAAHGEVSVLSDTPGADILLDGGIVARTAEGATLLKNVLAGARELRVRDFSAREARTIARVSGGKRINVTLNLRQSSRPAARNGLIPLGLNPEGFEEYWRSKDGAPVVKIPAGEFLMGTPEGQGEPAEHPQRRVTVSAFLIDKTEVTWRQYEKFLSATGTPMPKEPLWGTLDDYPVTAVIWSEASAFCEWVGGRLPTEAEWEKGARGTDGRKYPFGDDWDPDRCNTRDGGPHRPREVGSFPGCSSPYGVLDMAGSVWEFCQDWFDPNRDESDPIRGPKDPALRRTRIVRGGSWLDPSQSARTANRQGRDPTWRNVLNGFRCAQDVPESAR
jgi:formylglycine-generating enzyme required for sulfatase activity